MESASDGNALEGENELGFQKFFAIGILYACSHDLLRSGQFVFFPGCFERYVQLFNFVLRQTPECLSPFGKVSRLQAASTHTCVQEQG